MREGECQLEGCLFFSSAKLARVFAKIAEDAFHKLGLSPSHALLLYTINIKGSIHQKEVGELLELTPSTITRFVEKLENKGLISRKADGKNVFIYTTKQGLQMQHMLLEAWSNLQDSYKNILTKEETEQFIQISNKLISSMKG
jgi:DNA-binding MarR family transcriptional regulator